MITARLDEGSPVPPFEQLRRQLADAVRAGRLAPGTRLPSVRQLAGDLGLAPNTVAKAYKALEDEDLVRAHGRRGTVVTDAVTMSERVRRDRLDEAARRFLAEARRLGVDAADAADAVRELAR